MLVQHHGEWRVRGYAGFERHLVNNLSRGAQGRKTQFRENITLVLKYFDKLLPLRQPDSLPARFIPNSPPGGLR